MGTQSCLNGTLGVVEFERESKSRRYRFDSGRSEWYQRLSQGLHHRAVMGPFSGCSGLGTAFNQ
jgi:hypothetical protein